MTTLVPRPDTRPAPGTRPGVLVPVGRPARDITTIPAPAPVAVRRPTSGVPFVGYVTPPPYECTRRRAIARRATIEAVRTTLWVAALVPFIVINTALAVGGAARWTATAARRRVTGAAR